MHWPLGLTVLLGVLLLACVALLLRVICCPGARMHHWRCWSHDQEEEEEEDVRVRDVPHAEPLKAALLARQASGMESGSAPLLPSSSPRSQRFAHPLLGLLKPVLPGRLHSKVDSYQAAVDAAEHASRVDDYQDHTPTSFSSPDDPISPYSPTHTHPYAMATYQNPTWGSSGAAAILRPATDLRTPEVSSRTLQKQQLYPPRSSSRPGSNRHTPEHEREFRSIAREANHVDSLRT